MNKKVVFFGSGYYVIPIIEVLKNQGLSLVVTTESEGKLTDFLKKNQIPFLYSNLKNPENIEKIENLKPNIGVLASYGAILPKKILGLFPEGILNVHPSLLPKFKGPSPIQYTILSGNTETGVTIIKLDDKVDHGPIAIQETVELKGVETFQSLMGDLFSRGAELLNKVLKTEEPKFIPQDDSQESWSYKIKKTDGKIDINNPPTPEELDRKIRAYFPWPGVFFTVKISGIEKLIKLLPENKIQVEGKNPIDFKSFKNGYGKEALDILEKLGFN